MYDVHSNVSMSKTGIEGVRIGSEDEIAHARSYLFSAGCHTSFSLSIQTRPCFTYIIIVLSLFYGCNFIFSRREEIIIIYSVEF